MSKAKDLSATRRQRGMIRTSVTCMCLELCLYALEAKDTLTSSDLLTVKGLLKKVDALDVEFKEHHYAVIDLVGDDGQTLDEQQVVMDDHKDKVAEIIERLQLLCPESKAAPSVAHPTSHSHHLRKRLNHVERIVSSVKDEIKGLTPRPDLHNCLLHCTTVRGAVWQSNQRSLGHCPRYFVLGRRGKSVRYGGYTS